MLGLRKIHIGVLVTFLLSSILFTVLGIVFIDIVNWFIDVKLKENLPLTKGTIAFKFWQQPPVPVNFAIYVFHVANPDEIIAGTGVPAVIEKGPFVYKMHIEKTDIRWHDNNTIEYVQPQHFIFDREASVGPDTDTFLTLNIPYITAATILQHEMEWLQDFVDAYFDKKGEGAFMNRSVYDIWWGYKDPVLEELADIMHAINYSSPLLNGRFGFFMNRNNTSDGLYNIFSGVNEQFDNFVHIDRWNTEKKLSIWSSEYANTIRGTDGSMQPPLVTPDSKLSIFDAYLYRSLDLQYSGPSSYEGLRTLTFHIPYSEFANSTENPNNAGFCTPDCVPSGAYNMSVACYDAPIFVSMPHFVGGDAYYQSQVSGLSPSPNLHQPFYVIQPTTGVSMRIARRYQLNVRTQPFEYFTKFENFPVSYLPILWIDGTGDVDPATAAMFKKMIQDPLDIVPYLHGAVFAFSGLLLIICVGLFIYWRKKNAKVLYKYTKIEDREHSKLNGKAQPNYGAEGSLRNQLSTQNDDIAAITEILNHSTSPVVNHSIFQAGSGIIEADLHSDDSNERSCYFDTVTSPERSDKYHSLDAT